MAKGSSKHKRRDSNAGSRPAAVAAAAAVVPAWLVGAGAVCLAASCIASLLMALQHIAGLSLPGCGPGSPCAAAAASVWGKVPVLNWPVSFLGFAYFLGALVAWLAARGSVSAPFRTLVRLGALISFGFVLVLMIERHLCLYCLAAHVGNFAFWLLMERVKASPSASWRPLITCAVIFVITSAVLGATEKQERQAVAAKAEADLDASTAAIIEVSGDRSASPAVEPAKAAVAPGESKIPDQSGQADGKPADDYDPPWEGPFTGRYHWGPRKAPVRVVVYTDYQCVDCNRIEEQVRRLIETRDDVSISPKHFPMCSDCNPGLTKNLHPNACWAARAAAAAGIIHGHVGFKQMHQWLFDVDGSFTNESLPKVLREMGYDPHEFIQVMTGKEALRRVQSDIEEAKWLGLHYTPMIFINGVELKGWNAPNALIRAVEKVAATGPKPRGPKNDRPPAAVEKYIADWRAQPQQRIPSSRYPLKTDEGDLKVRIIMWADYQEPHTAAADRIILDWMENRRGVEYSFRHFPFDMTCNPRVQTDRHPKACMAARAVEAAGILAGPTGYWNMHRWLMSHQDELSDETLTQAATEMGLDAFELFQTMENTRVTSSIELDCAAGKARLYRSSIPTIFVNGKVIPRWRRKGERILERILNETYEDEALKPASPPQHQLRTLD